MLAARRRAALCLACRLQRPSRAYASHSHGHHAKPAEVNESFGKGSAILIGTFFGGVLLYQVSPRPGEESAISSLISKYLSRAEDWAEINAAHTRAMEQAGFDRNLFENSSNKHRFVDVSYPEALQSYAPRNVRAGHLLNLDHVVEHYRQKHLTEEARKARKLAEQNN